MQVAGLTPTQKGMILALCVVQVSFVYGSVFLKERLAAGGATYHPVIFALYREVIAGVILVSASTIIYGHGLHMNDAPVIGGMGLALFLNQLLYIIGLEFAGVTIATCMQPSIPVFTIALAMYLGQESTSAQKITGTLAAASGAILIVYGSSQKHDHSAGAGTSPLLGSLCMIGNCLSMATYFILARKLSGKYPSLCITAWTYLTAAAWMAVTAVATVPFSDWTLPQRVHGPLVYWIFVSSIAGYSIMTLATRYLPASQVSAFVCLQPFIGTLLAIVKLGEKVTTWDLGGLGVVAGLMIVLQAGDDSLDATAELKRDDPEADDLETSRLQSCPRAWGEALRPVDSHSSLSSLEDARRKHTAQLLRPQSSVSPIGAGF